MLGNISGLARGSSSSTDWREALFPHRSSFRRSTDQGFAPSRWRSTFLKKLFKLMAIAVCLLSQAPVFAAVRQAPVGAERCLAKPEREVSNTVEFEQLAIHMTTARALGGCDQLGRLPRVQFELDDRARDIPRHVLAADEIMPGVVIEGVGLEQTTGRANPFVRQQAIVGANGNDAACELIKTRFPLLR